MKAKAFEPRQRQLRGAEMTETRFAAPIHPALGDREPVGGSALQDADQMPPGPRPDLDSYSPILLCDIIANCFWAIIIVIGLLQVWIESALVKAEWTA